VFDLTWFQIASGVESQMMKAGPAFSRLLPIGPRAEGGLIYANLHFVPKLFV